jgi:hypothetical protein
MVNGGGAGHTNWTFLQISGGLPSGKVQICGVE